jgi:hypothetical protein
MYPGLSPGGSVPGVRYDSHQFFEESRAAALNCDAVAVHCYWAPQIGFSMAGALNWMDHNISRAGGKPIWITEASNNRGGITPDQKAAEYVQFWQACRARAAVRGVTYFVSWASNPLWNWDDGGHAETWVPVGMGARVRQGM